MNLHNLPEGNDPVLVAIRDFLRTRFKGTYWFKIENGTLMERSLRGATWYECDTEYWRRYLKNLRLL